MVSWGYWDQNIRLCSVETGKVLLVIKTSHDDEILCADITQDGQYLATGGTSSLLKVCTFSSLFSSLLSNFFVADTHGACDQVWKLKRVKRASSRGRMRIRLQAILSGHAHDVLSVVISKVLLHLSSDRTAVSTRRVSCASCVCRVRRACRAVVQQEWSLIISGGREGKVILWDLNRLCYIRTLKHHRGPVTSLAISPTTGDIVTVDNGTLHDSPHDTHMHDTTHARAHESHAYADRVGVHSCGREAITTKRLDNLPVDHQRPPGGLHHLPGAHQLRRPHPRFALPPSTRHRTRSTAHAHAPPRALLTFPRI